MPRPPLSPAVVAQAKMVYSRLGSLRETAAAVGISVISVRRALGRVHQAKPVGGPIRLRKPRTCENGHTTYFHPCVMCAASRPPKQPGPARRTHGARFRTAADHSTNIELRGEHLARLEAIRRFRAAP